MLNEDTSLFVIFKGHFWLYDAQKSKLIWELVSPLYDNVMKQFLSEFNLNDI